VISQACVVDVRPADDDSRQLLGSVIAAMGATAAIEHPESPPDLAGYVRV
jgi:hypothetical protein